jgi:hypothetical protein
MKVCTIGGREFLLVVPGFPFRKGRRLTTLKDTHILAYRRIFGPKRDEVTWEWRKLHNEELNDMHCSPNIVRVLKSRRMRWAGHVARMGKGRGVYRVLVGKPEGKRPVGRSRRRWEDNIKMSIPSQPTSGSGM